MLHGPKCLFNTTLSICTQAENKAERFEYVDCDSVIMGIRIYNRSCAASRGGSTTFRECFRHAMTATTHQRRRSDQVSIGSREALAAS